MRTAPPLTLDVPRPAGWRWMVRLLGLAAAASLLGWMGQAADPAMDLARAALGLLALAALLAAAGRVDAAPCRLGWDGATWTLTPVAGPARAPASGRLRVMLDLSVALLLRFEPDEPGSAGRAVCWIPVGRRRLPPSQWQALRRTVYSARPPAGGSPGGDGPRTE